MISCLCTKRIHYNVYARCIHSIFNIGPERYTYFGPERLPFWPYKIDKTKKTCQEEFWRAMERVWNSVTIEELRKYINTMPARCKTVIAAKGGHTRY